MDFAIIETGGKQYKVVPGKSIDIEKIANVKEGDAIIFDKVLMTVDGEKVEMGNPYLKDLTIEVTVDKAFRGKKIRVVRFKAKARYRKHTGHRQSLLKVSLPAKVKATKALRAKKSS